MRTIKEVMDLSVSNLDLSVRCTNCMRNMNISNLSELTAKSKEEIAGSRNVGKKSLEEIESKLSEFGLFWQMTDRDWLNWGVSHIEWIKRH